MDFSQTPNYLRYGGAKKPLSEMSAQELLEVADSIVRRAKENAFSRGRPIIYGSDGKVFQEWPDGHIVEIAKEHK